MPKPATYSLWLQPSGKMAFQLQEKIRKLSEKYGTPLFAPHITLLGGLHSTKAGLISLSDTLASTLHPLDLTLTTAGCRNRFYQSLFIYVEKSKPLMELRSMAERFFDASDDENYMPHLSLLYGDFTRKEKEKMLNGIGREFYRKISVKSLALMQTNGKPEQWKKIYTAVFKKA